MTRSQQHSSERRRRGGRGSGRGRSRGRSMEAVERASPAALAPLKASLDQAEYIVFDLETTGGNPEKNGITEIYAIRFKDGIAHDTFGTLVNPQIPIPPIVRRMTGINNKMV